MASESVTIGLSTFFGLGLLVVIAGSILFYQHRRDIKRLRASQAEAEARAAHAAANDLPPEYIDHVHDPVCIYEHELPPEAAALARPILVHSMSQDQLVSLPNQDPLSVTSASNGTSGAIGPRPETVSPQVSPLSPAEGQDEISLHHTPSNASLASGAIHETIPSPTISALRQQGGPSTPVDLGTVSNPSLLSLPLSTISTSYTRSDLELELELADLPPPPSYDTPNRTVEVSPLPMPASVYIPMTDYFDPRAIASSSSLDASLDAEEFTSSPVYHRPFRGHSRARAHSDLAGYQPHNIHLSAPSSPSPSAMQRTESSPGYLGGRVRLPRSLQHNVLWRQVRDASPSSGPWSSTLPPPAVADIRGGRNGSGRIRSSTVGSDASPRLWVQQIRRAFAQRSATSSASSSMISLGSTSRPSTPYGGDSPVTATSSIEGFHESVIQIDTAGLTRSHSMLSTSEGTTTNVVQQPRRQEQQVEQQMPSTNAEEGLGLSLETEIGDTTDAERHEEGEDEVGDSVERSLTAMNTGYPVVSSPQAPVESNLVHRLAVPTLALSAA
ncbi:hypothetical protein BGW41_000181 [Actinomortierella wolfii]|nr:hypothetical protein BGW41_000181 [Actinomortierella wolfii]